MRTIRVDDEVYAAIIERKARMEVDEHRPVSMAEALADLVTESTTQGGTP